MSKFKRAIAALAIASGVLSLSGCYQSIDTAEKIAEAAKVKAACEQAGGLFVRWASEIGEFYRCDLTSEEAR